jgi:hypothetical protein
VLVALTILVPGIASWSLVDVLLREGVCGALELAFGVALLGSSRELRALRTNEGASAAPIAVGARARPRRSSLGVTRRAWRPSPGQLRLFQWR